MTTKKAKDLLPGDRIDTDDGVKTVTSNTNGMLIGHRHIEWRGGFGEIPQSARVETL